MDRAPPVVHDSPRAAAAGRSSTVWNSVQNGQRRWSISGSCGRVATFWRGRRWLNDQTRVALRVGSSIPALPRILVELEKFQARSMPIWHDTRPVLESHRAVERLSMRQAIRMGRMALQKPNGGVRRHVVGRTITQQLDASTAYLVSGGHDAGTLVGRVLPFVLQFHGARQCICGKTIPESLTKLARRRPNARVVQSGQHPALVAVRRHCSPFWVTSTPGPIFNLLRREL